MWRSDHRANGLQLRAVVLRTYLPDDPDHPGNDLFEVGTGDAVGGQLQTAQVTRLDMTRMARTQTVLCDVLVYSPSYRSILRLVPVAYPAGRNGVAGGWIPRAAFSNASGALPAGMPGVSYDDVTDPLELDGDHVKISFLDDDLNSPIVDGLLSHPKAQQQLVAYRSRTAARGPASEYVIQHRGTTLIFDSDGNLTIEAHGASSGQLDSAGEEVAGTGGKISIRTKAAQKIILEGGTIELGESAAQQVVLGNNFCALINSLMVPTPFGTFGPLVGGAPLYTPAPAGNPAEPTGPHLSTQAYVRPAPNP
jgi:hypothetical protein